jgi:hypothetical protein
MVVWFGKIVVKVQGILCKEKLRIRRKTAKVVAVSELAR